MLDKLSEQEMTALYHLLNDQVNEANARVRRAQREPWRRV
jgi:hypothetical protein